jgi:hypothetical protein
MRRVLVILLVIIGLSPFAFADKGFISFSGGLGAYAYLSPEELQAFRDNPDMNYLNQMRLGALIDLNFNLSKSFSIGVESGAFINCDPKNLAYYALQFDIPLYAFMRFQPGLLFLQPEAGVIFDMTKLVPGSPLYEMAQTYDQPVPSEEAFSLSRFSVDLGTKIGISLGGLAIYGDIGLIWDTFDDVARPGFTFRLGAGLLFGV